MRGPVLCERCTFTNNRFFETIFTTSEGSNTYFNKDNEGLTIFDYAALGKTPDEKPSLLKIETSESEAADPSGKSTLQAILEKVMSRQEATQEYFTGRKVMNDCQTFPYCNH